MTERFGPAPDRRRVIGIGLIGVAALLAGGVVAILTQGPSAPSSAAVLATASPAPRSTSREAAPAEASSIDQGRDQDTDAVPDDDGLAADSSARVTRAGDGLRVRTEPGLGGGSAALSPLLPAGTRVFVLDGPEHADGYDWYQVLAESEDFRLFGWVAAGKGDQQWLAYDPRPCEEEPTTAEVIERSPTDYLSCYGNAPVTVAARINDGLGPLSEGITEEDYACPDLIAVAGCDLTEAWLQIPLGGLYFPLGDTEASIYVALPPELEARFYDAPLQQDVQLTLAMDSAEARDCRILDSRTGKNHVTRDEVVTRCRLNFVLRDIEW